MKLGGADSSKFPIFGLSLREVGFPPFMQQAPGGVDVAERTGHCRWRRSRC